MVAGIKLRDELEGEWTLIAGYVVILGIVLSAAGLRLRAVSTRLIDLARPSQA